MKELKYFDERSFKSEDVQFTDDHYNLMENIHKLYERSDILKCTPIMVGNDKDSLIFCVNLSDRSSNVSDWESGKNIYRIKVEKIII